ncbi:hypothetical protein N826_10720 [Skermanella aerolata KACC 11604]|nr:hypothetical protein N826_10720 [Skermanella aerolata KACC 11604]
MIPPLNEFSWETVMADQNQADRNEDKPEKKNDGASQKTGNVDQKVQEEAAEERKEGGYQ